MDTLLQIDTQCYKWMLCYKCGYSVVAVFVTLSLLLSFSAKFGARAFSLLYGLEETNELFLCLNCLISSPSNWQQQQWLIVCLCVFCSKMNMLSCAFENFCIFLQQIWESWITFTDECKAVFPSNWLPFIIHFIYIIFYISLLNKWIRGFLIQK